MQTKRCKGEVERKDVLQTSSSEEQFDIIVSNPPYITEKEKTAMEANVLEWEPSVALFVPDEQPLLFYTKIAELGLEMLVSGGRLYFEINRDYGAATVSMLERLGYHHVELRKDLSGNDDGKSNKMKKECSENEVRNKAEAIARLWNGACPK